MPLIRFIREWLNTFWVILCLGDSIIEHSKGKYIHLLKRKGETTLNFCCCQVSLKANELLTFQLAFIFVPSIHGQYSFVEVHFLIYFLFIYLPHECFKDHRQELRK